MNQLHQPHPRLPERFWLHRTQWRTVAALMLLLAVVVASLALASGFWWALHVRPVRSVKAPPMAPPVPVATVTIPVVSASVVEVYPLQEVRTAGQQIIARSPGGTVADIPVRVGQRVSAGQMLARMEQPLPPSQIARAPLPTVPDETLARQRAEADRLRQRLEQVRSEIQNVKAVSATAARTGRREPARAREPLTAEDPNVERARRMLDLATDRRREMDQRYADHRATRFEFHLARSRELLAQVELRRAEEEAPLRQAAAPAPAEGETRAADRDRRRQIARLERTARGLEARLARVRQRVAGARQRLDSPAPPTTAVKLARAPRTGTVAAVWTKPGAKLAAGAPLLAIDLPGRPRLRARVDRQALTVLQPGARVTIRGHGGRTFLGHVARVEREPGGTGIVELLPPRRARLDGNEALVPPIPKPAAPTLPAAALIPGARPTAVWLAVRRSDRSGGWLARRWRVRAVPAGRSRVAVLAGLHPGSRVIVAGSRGISEGQPVAPVEVGELSPG